MPVQPLHSTPPGDSARPGKSAPTSPVVAPEVAVGHPAQVATALGAAAARRARGILANRLQAAVVVPEPCPRTLEPGPVLAAQLGAAFGEDAPAAAAELAAEAAAGLAALRPQDLRAAPFITTSVTCALASLAELPRPLGPGELGTEQASALAVLEGPARRASRAAGCRALRRRRLAGARRELAGALGALQARLVPLLARQVVALAAEQLAAQLSQRLAAMEAARERVLALCEARHYPRPAEGLLPGPGGPPLLGRAVRGGRLRRSGVARAGAHRAAPPRSCRATCGSQCSVAW
jgi:hypothetical protein